MKLSDHQIKQVCAQHPVQPLPEYLPVMAELKKTFGEHTFFLLLDGLYVWEYSEVAGESGGLLNAVRVGVYADKERNKITPQPPERTQVFVALAPEPLTRRD